MKWISFRVLVPLFFLMFGARDAFSGMKVRETVVLKMNSDLLNSQLREAVRKDVDLGVINVYDGASWKNGPASIHFNKAEVSLLDKIVNVSLSATVTSALGRKTIVVTKALDASSLTAEMDINGICRIVSNLSASVLAASDVMTDMAPGSASAPIGILKNYLSKLVLVDNFATYSRGTAIEKCYPASFTGVASFSIEVGAGVVKIVASPEIEYLTLTTGLFAQVQGTANPKTMKLTFTTNFPMAFRSPEGSYNTVNGKVSLTEIKSGMSTTTDGKVWRTIASCTYSGPNNTVLPDVLFDLESPCGEYVQRYKMNVVGSIVGVTLNSSAGIP